MGGTTKSNGGILSHFKGIPRPQQLEALLELQARWREADVFVVRAPVACGKSRMAACLTAWTGQGGIVTPTNNLVAQYGHDFPDLAQIGHRASYTKADEWAAAKREFAQAPRFVANYFTYLAHRNYRPTMVFDEAHRLVPTLQDQEAIRLWDHAYPIPSWVATTTDLLAWCQQFPKDGKLVKLAARLATHPDTFSLDVSWGVWRGRTERVWTLRPLTPRLNRPLLWPSKVRKLVLMSATIYPDDLYDLGLETRRVAYISVGSPIPPAQRPVLYSPAANPSFANRADAVPRLVAGIQAVAAQHPGQRGLVHAPYSLAAALAEAGLDADPRYVFHTPATAGAQYHRWLRAGGDQILVCSGMSEGLDLVDDLARFQIVTKIGYQSKADPAVLAKLAIRPEWYAAAAVRELEQTVGRVCRGPEDFGVTYILTSEFPGLYRQGQELGLWSSSLIESLDTVGV
jgi:hypothetical protein